MPAVAVSVTSIGSAPCSGCVTRPSSAITEGSLLLQVISPPAVGSAR